MCNVRDSYEGPTHGSVLILSHTHTHFSLSECAHCFESSSTLWSEGVKRRLPPRPWGGGRTSSVSGTSGRALSRAHLAGGCCWHRQPSYRAPFISVWTCGPGPNPGRSRRAGAAEAWSLWGGIRLSCCPQELHRAFLLRSPSPPPSSGLPQLLPTGCQTSGIDLLPAHPTGARGLSWYGSVAQQLPLIPNFYSCQTHKSFLQVQAPLTPEQIKFFQGERLL